MSVARLFLFTGPAVSVVIGLVLTIVWLTGRERRYVLFFACAFFAYALAALSQMLWLPPDPGSNAMVSTAIYTFAVLCMSEGLLARSGREESGSSLVAVGISIVVFIYYFYYVDGSLAGRIYSQNFGYGAMFLMAAMQSLKAGSKRWIDRVLLSLFILIGVHFFLRTILTMSSSEHLDEIERMLREGPDPAKLRALAYSSPFWPVLNFSLLVSGILMALALFGAVALDLVDDVKREGRIDVLTGLANRRGFEIEASTLWDDPSSYPLSLIFCDIDHFKQINDTYGHAVGDQVLAAFGDVIAGEIEPKDVAARPGGEEFVILLARTNRAGAALVAERLRSGLEFTHFTPLPSHATVTASFGVAERRAGESLHGLLARADALVYAANNAGRNRLYVETPEEAVSARPSGDRA